MSKLPFVPIFSAAHLSQWDALPEDTCIRTTQLGFGPERAAQYNDAGHDGCAPLSQRRVFSMREWQVTTPVGDVVVARPASSPKSCEIMAVKTHTWISLWFLVTAPIIIWDAMYCFMRPRSMTGGDLHWIWEPYGLYQDIDYMYGVPALEKNDGFTNAQSLLNVVETAMNLAYLYFAHVSSWPGAPLVGFAAAIMTLSKTVLYWAVQYYCSWCDVGHNAWDTFILLWLLPNGFWLLFPSMIVWRLGADIIASLAVAAQSARKVASGKTQ